MPRLFCVLTVFAALAAAAGAADEDGFKLLELDGHLVKWGAPRLGRGAVVTWRIAFAHPPGAGGDNCKRTTGFDTLLAQTKLSREDALRAADSAFALWSRVADIRFVPAGTDRPADITIAAEAVADGIAYSDVTPAADNNEHVASLSRAIVCLNPQANWTVAATGTYRLAYVMAHEIGHAIGLDHPGPDGTLMSFEYDPAREGLQPGDIAGAAALYGPAARLVSNVN